MQNRAAMTQAMKASISDVLEQMFYLPLDFLDVGADDAAIHDVEDFLVARLAFSGNPSGRFFLQVPRDLALSATCDFLGVTPSDLEPGQVEGTLLEMINMLAGNALSHYDSATLFDLDMPMTCERDALRDAMRGEGEVLKVGISTPGGRMHFNLVVP